MKLLSFLPYLIVFVILAGYLYFRMGTAARTARRKEGSTLWHARGRARRKLRIARDWDSLGDRARERDGADEPQGGKKGASGPDTDPDQKQDD